MTVRSHWCHLADRLNLPAGLADDAWQEIEAAYCQPHRHYHTLTHIAAVLADLDRHRLLFDDVDMAELALIYHDIVYDAGRQDNEAQSAVWLRDRLSSHVEQGRLDRAAAHIEATRHHDLTNDADANLLLDLDMAILSAAWPDYLAYAQGVYAEYLPVYGPDAYAMGRVKLFIEPTLAKSRIFLTDAFADAEPAARQNLAQERDLWLNGGFGTPN